MRMSASRVAVILSLCALGMSVVSACAQDVHFANRPAPMGRPPVAEGPSSYSEPGAAVPIPVTGNEDPATRNTAIALNYCRASFHRIRKYPTKPVLAEEQEKILNNLNLQGIEDPEVIQLYTSVLDEINQVEVADRERYLYRSNHKNSVQRKITWDLLAFSTDMATGQYGNAVRQGANSWWDYRGMVYQRDTDLMKVDKGRMQSVSAKSSNFLDTFWKLARKKNIPDRWLVRGDDLDSLEEAQREQDPEVKLRILRRMEPYMQAYPPYWYYVARAEQELGALIAAADMYQHVARIGDGHFRKDDMLATSMANLAAIQDHLGSSDAVVSAHRALNYSTDVWEANLICARVLERNGRVADAEDAILRNLDVALEMSESRVFLASLYYHSDNKGKLARMLDRPDIVAELPAPVLLRCAACLGVERTPEPVMQAVLASLQVESRQQLSGDELLVRLSPAWQLHLARVDVLYQGRALQPVPVERIPEGHQLRFAGRFDLGSSASRVQDAPVAISFTYPDRTVVRVGMESEGMRGDGRFPLSRLPTLAAAARSSSGLLRVSSVSVNDQRIALGNADIVPRFAPPVDPYRGEGGSGSE